MSSAAAVPDPPAPPEALRAELHRLLAVAERVRHAVVAEVLQEDGLAWSHWLVLDELLEAPGLTPTRLARQLGLAPSTLSGVLGALRREHLVLTDPDRRDCRRTVLTLTPRGSRLAAVVRRREAAALSRLLAGLTPEDIGVVNEGARRLDQALAAAGR